MEIIRTYKYRLKPTAEQAERLNSWCVAVRQVYNAALEQRLMYGRINYTKRRDGDALVELNWLISDQLAQLDVLISHKLIPRAVSREELTHPGHDIDRHVIRTHRFVAQLHQAGVMTNVAMREKDAGKPRPRDFACRRNSIKHAQLIFEVRRGVNNPSLR